MADVTLNYLNEEREKTWDRIEKLESSIDELNKNIQEALDLAKSKISVDEANAKTALVNATAYAETAKNKSQEITQLLEEINLIIDNYKTNKTLLENSIKKAEEIDEKHDELMENAIGEFYAHLANVKNMVAVEYDPDRADIYKCIYPHCYVFPDDINKVMEAFIAKAKEYNCSLLMASPPCQGHSKANQSENKDEDIRNRLVLKVTEAVEKGNFDTVMIENVPEFLDYSSDTILPELEGKNIRQYLEEFFRTHGYMVNFYQRVDARKYSSTPQQRVRAIVLASRIGEWTLPPMLPKEQWGNLEKAIGDLPSLEAGERGIEKYENDLIWSKKLNELKYHTAPYWPERDIEIMKHTATGCSAFDNPLEYRPTKKDGTPKEYYRSAYRRPKWNDAFPCILKESDGMGGMITCHPGRLQEDGTYSDARAYTVLELLRGYDLPHDFPFPAWTLDEDKLQREVLGEAFAPRLVQRILEVMPR